MESLYLLIPLSLGLVAFSAWLLRWSVKSGQYDDVNGPGQAILMDDDTPDLKQIKENPDQLPD
jgi:cbb3-type cytochrome oxidase maturation protein